MRRRRGQITSLPVGILLSLARLCLLSPAAADPCPPSAVIAGDPALVQSLFATVSLSDMSRTALPGCPAVWVTVKAGDGGLFVRIEDHLGRRHERTVGDVETAAAVIESWARGDALMSALPALAPASPPPAPPVVATDTPKPTAAEPSMPDSAPGRDGACADTEERSSWDITTGAGFEYTLGSDGSSWFGGGAYWCTVIGFTCLGAAVRGAADPMLSGDYRRLSDIRTSMDAMLTLSLSIDLRRVRIIPTVGFGTGWVQTSREVLVGGQTEVREMSFGGGRVSLVCMVSLNLVRGLYLDMSAGITSSFIAEEELVTIDDQPVAGEPRYYFRFGLGLAHRWS